MGRLFQRTRAPQSGSGTQHQQTSHRRRLGNDAEAVEREVRVGLRRRVQRERDARDVRERERPARREAAEEDRIVDRVGVFRDDAGERGGG